MIWGSIILHILTQLGRLARHSLDLPPNRTPQDKMRGGNSASGKRFFGRRTLLAYPGRKKTVRRQCTSTFWTGERGPMRRCRCGGQAASARRCPYICLILSGRPCGTTKLLPLLTRKSKVEVDLFYRGPGRSLGVPPAPLVELPG